MGMDAIVNSRAVPRATCVILLFLAATLKKGKKKQVKCISRTYFV